MMTKKSRKWKNTSRKKRKRKTSSRKQNSNLSTTTQSPRMKWKGDIISLKLHQLARQLLLPTPRRDQRLQRRPNTSLSPPASRQSRVLQIRQNRVTTNGCSTWTTFAAGQCQMQATSVKLLLPNKLHPLLLQYPKVTNQCRKKK